MSRKPRLNTYVRVAVDKRVKHHRCNKGDPTYSTWVNMLTRCRNPKSTQYPWYGAIGIRVCERWETFTNFLADMGERPKGKTLDRIDGAGNYELRNCRWATQKEQGRNKRNVRAVFRSDGMRFDTMSEAAEAIGGNYKEIWAVCNGKGKTHKGYGWKYA